MAGDIVRDYVIEHVGDDDAVLVIDETGFQAGRLRAEWRGPIYGSAGNDPEMPDRRSSCLRSRHVMRSFDRALYFRRMDRRSLA